jgi:RHS repeat-associated protein
MKKIFLLLSLFVGLKSFGQVLDPSPSVSIVIVGNAAVAEGAVEEYLVKFSGSVPPPNQMNFVRTIVNGTELSFTLSGLLTNAYDLKVKWNCKPIGNGNIKINETVSTAQASLIVALSSYANPPINGNANFCTSLNNGYQQLLFGQTAAGIGVICSRYCDADYGFTFQWQKKIGGTPANPIYQNITGATNDIYYPPTYNVPNVSIYRRVTKFTVAAGLQTINSSDAYIEFVAPLSAGTINSSMYYLYNTTVPIITQAPATGGSCPSVGIAYTWQILPASQSSWQNVGSDVEFPTGLLFTEDTRVRRRAICGFQEAYTNEQSFVVRPLLTAGTIACTAATNLPYNSLPIITQVKALWGLCDFSSHTYTWERQLVVGVWDVIGTGIEYPTTALMVGNMRVRRKVTCGPETLYTNELYITMAPYISPNTENQHYVRVNDIVIPGIHTWAQADGLPTGSKLQTTTYLDNFGRPMQQVVKQGSLKADATDPNAVSSYQDLVTITDYDGLGRTAKGYLPYATATNLGFFKTNTYTEQESFNNTLYNEPAGSHATFSTTTYDGSPLNRVTAIRSAGAAYQAVANNGITSDYDFNKDAEQVHVWNIDYPSGSLPTDGGIYLQNTLIKTITKDANSKLVYEYKDLQGKVVLKKVQEKDDASFDINGYSGWLSTYYVYDDFGRLRYTITPKAVAAMFASGNWEVTAEIAKGLCFYQEYDKRGRITIKHAADGGEVWMIYDKRDRLVLTQDENQRNRAPKPNQWSFSLYDEQDRSVATGLINDDKNQAAMQDWVTNISSTFYDQVLNVSIYTGSWEKIKVTMPVAGKTESWGGYFCGSCTATFTNSVTYFDDYANTSHTYQRPNNGSFAPTDNPYLEGYAKTARVNGMATGGKIRILDDKYDNLNETDDQFLASTSFYDERGRVVQSHSQNIKGGVDMASMQYDYAGKVLSTYTLHKMPNNEFDNFACISKNEYDLLQRATALSKMYFSMAQPIAINNVYKKLAEYRYDVLGRVKTKKIGTNPLNANEPIEIQDYSYNILGALTGVNKDYALAGADNGGTNPTLTAQFSRRFGYYLGYASTENKFTNAQYNGNITGVIWRSQGDNTFRKYNYKYDAVDRFTEANFTQKTDAFSNTWVNNKVDLTVNIAGYDANGNILGMQQKGIVPGTAGGVEIDNLTYTYYPNSSKLKEVVDNASGVSGNQGDFRDMSNGTNIDYDYDSNGNLLFDVNKGITSTTVSGGYTEPGIVHNFLDLPEKITIFKPTGGKYMKEYIYDAAGNKLAKIVKILPLNSNSIKTTYYIGEFVYEAITPVGSSTEDPAVLQYILHEEGKLRIIEPVAAWSPPSMQVNRLDITGNIDLINNGSTHKWGVWDYYLKDNLSNTRMVLTEEGHKQEVLCSMESGNPARLGEENDTFGENELTATRDARPPGWPSGSGTNIKAAKLKYNESTHKGGVGPNAIFKVMAGDFINARADYFYQQTAANSDNGNGILPNIIAALVNSIGGPVTPANNGIKDAITNNYLSSNGTINPFTNTQPTPASPATPKAYINVIFFDEQFNYVAEKSQAFPIQAFPNTPLTLPTPNIRAPKNGYVYVYLSNDSRNIPVYFDNFSVIHTRREIVEDNAYYPYGLKIAGISARAVAKPITKEGYQGDYAEHDEETGYDEFQLRSYDAQIGRWIQNDPYEQYASGYVGMGNDPVNSLDTDGGESTVWGKRLGENGHMQYKWFSDAAGVDKGWEAISSGFRFFENGTGKQWEGNWDGTFHLISQTTITSPLPTFEDIGEPTFRAISDPVAYDMRSERIASAIAYNKEMAERAAQDPISYGGPGMGMGLVRDPLFQFTTQAILKGPSQIVVGGVQTYAGIRDGDYLQASLGAVGMGFGVYQTRSIYLSTQKSYLNLASESRTNHIISGDQTGGGHAWFGSKKSFINGVTGEKTMFPPFWSNKKIMNAASNVIVNNPILSQTGKAGSMFEKSGRLSRYTTVGEYGGVKIKVVWTNTDIITSHPVR